MIGIDLTDLSDPLLKSRKNAIRLISHPEDRINQNNNFWHLWCSKEAVFKALRKRKTFIPKNFPVQFINKKKYLSENLFGSIEETRDFVCSIASSTESYIYVLFNSTTDNPSLEIRHLITQWFKRNHMVHTSVINDEKGLPILSHNRSPISISHHGRYLAFAYLK